MKYVNDMVRIDTCRSVEMYEKAIRIEDIFAQTNGVEEFSSKLLDATSGKNGTYHQVIVMTSYFTVVGKSPDEITGYAKDWGNYQACRMMQSI